MKCIAAISVGLLLGVTGCLKPDPVPRFTPAWESFDPKQEGWQRTGKILLVSDCQFHNLLSKPLPERNLTVKAAIGTAIRSPQLDMFAPDVMRWILKTTAPECEGVLHLGDGLDLACENEFDEFVSVMATAGKPWVMAPGNHDFYYFGVYDPEDVGLWEDACYEGGRVVTKDLFIRLYVATILRQSDPGFVALADALGVADHRGEVPAELGVRLPTEFEWQADDDAPGFLRSICWKINEKEPWRSFIIQAVESSVPNSDWKFNILVLDSCQYAQRPGLIPNAWASYPLVLNCGSTGEMLPDQLRVVRRWLEQSRKLRGYSFACHHPFDGLAPRTKASLGWLWREMRVGLMLTGHTHEGYYAHHDLGGEYDELELNIASTTDWPMEWRTVTGFINPVQERIYVESERFTLVDELRKKGGYFELGWEVAMGAPDDYRKYKVGEAASALLVDFYLAHHLVPYWLPQPRVRPNQAARDTEVQVKDTMLWTHYRLVQDYPTDTSKGKLPWPSGTRDDRMLMQKILAMTGQKGELEKKVAFLKQLADFERSRHTVDPRTGKSSDDVRERYKLSQAAWASRFEKEKGRRLRVEDDLIRVDWEKALARKQEVMDRADAEDAEKAGEQPDKTPDK